MVPVVKTNWLTLLAERGERIVDANNWHVFLAWRTHLPLKQLSAPIAVALSSPSWGHAQCYTAGTSVFRSHQISESFLPFLHVWPLSLLYEMCNPGREAGEVSYRNTPSSWPASQWLGPQPRPLTEASQDPISPLSAWHLLLPWCVIEETERNLAKRLFLWANLMAE